MLKRLDELEQKALKDLEGALDEPTLQAWKVSYLGRGAELGKITEGLRELSKEERPAVGRRANEVKKALEAAYEERVARQDPPRQPDASPCLCDFRRDGLPNLPFT
jgi:phenylalanyl-tRNA synthetase alpha chain